MTCPEEANPWRQKVGEQLPGAGARGMGSEESLHGPAGSYWVLKMF